MNQTLKTSLISSYDKGIHTFRIRSFFQNLRTQIDQLNLRVLKEQELRLIQQNPHWAELSFEEQQSALTQVQRHHIQSLPLYPLYQALIEDDSEDSLEVLSALSDDQFKQMIDLDIWQDGELILEHSVKWLARYATLSSKELVERFMSLDQEHQLTIIGELVKGYSPEEVEHLDEIKKNSLLSFPRDAYFYEILPQDDKIVTTTIDLIEALQEHNMEYALSLLSHTTWLSALENKELAWQFSRARREELGFIPQHRAQKSFVFHSPREITDFYTHLSQLLASSAPSPPSAQSISILPTAATSVDLSDSSTPTPFLFALLQYLDTYGLWQRAEYQSLIDDWLMCANHLASASGLHPSKLTDRDFLFEHILAAQSLALDLLSSHDTPTASRLITQLSCKTLMKYITHMLHPLRAQVATILTNLGLVQANFRFLVESVRYGMIQDSLECCLDFYGLEHTERLKGFFNRFPLQVEGSESFLHRQFASHKHKALYHIPLSTAAAFRQLMAEIITLLRMTKLVHTASIHTASHDQQNSHRASLDSLWLRSLANVLMDGAFIPRRFQASLIQKFISLERGVMQARFEKFCAELPSVTTDVDLMALIQHMASPIQSNPVSPNQAQAVANESSFSSLILEIVDQRTHKILKEYYHWLCEIQGDPQTHHLLLPRESTTSDESTPSTPAPP